MENAKYFLGIDGGGTKTVFALADEDDNIVGMLEKSNTNPNDIGIAETGRILREGIEEIRGDIDCGCISVYAGISGGGPAKNRTAIKQLLDGFGFAACGNGNDLENIAGCTEGKRKIVLIMGTGFSVYAINGEERFRIGGWGQLFDAGGCGYTIGRDSVYAAMRECDGTGEKTLLTSLLREKTGGNADDNLLKFYEGGKKYIASFAPLCFDAYRQGDDVACRIIRDNMKFVAENLRAASARLGGGEIHVTASGGLCRDASIIFPMIDEHIKGTGLVLHVLDREPVYGAVANAKRLCRRLTV